MLVGEYSSGDKVRRRSREIPHHKVDARSRQLGVAPAAVQMIVVKQDQSAFVEPTDPAERSRTRELGAVCNVADRISTLAYVGVEEMEQDIPGWPGID
jgi:hypothetical protein